MTRAKLDNDALLRLIADVLAQRLNVDAGTITRETTAEDVDGWDSVTHTLIVLEVERRLGVTFDMNEVLDASDVGELVDLAAREVGRTR